MVGGVYVLTSVRHFGSRLRAVAPPSIAEWGGRRMTDRALTRGDAEVFAKELVISGGVPSRADGEPGGLALVQWWLASLGVAWALGAAQGYCCATHAKT